MENRIKKFDAVVEENLPVLSSIRFTDTKNNTDSRQFWMMACKDSSHPITARCFDKNIMLGNNSTAYDDYEYQYTGGSYVYVHKKEGETYPQEFTLEIFPKYNLMYATIENLTDIDKYMTYLEKVEGIDRTNGDIANLANAPTLQWVGFSATPNNEGIYGDVASLDKLVNLTYIHTRGNQIWGDIADMCDGMVANGRVAGTLEFHVWSTLAYLTYNDTIIRPYDKYDNEPGDGGTAKTVYGFNITFTNSGWELTSIINTTD